MANFDTVLEKVGSFGRYQKQCWILCTITVIFPGMQHMANVYLQATPLHWCHVPEISNLSVSEQINITTPPRDLIYDDKSCLINDLDYSKAYDQYVDGGVLPNRTASVACSSWDYDYQPYGQTAVTKWNLVCTKNKYPDYAQTIYMFGSVLGAAIFGHLSDRFGRKVTLCAGLNGLIVFGVMSALVPGVWGHVILRMFAGICASGSYTVSIVLPMEILGINRRALPGVFQEYLYTIGYVALGGIAYLVKDFTWTNLIISILPVITLPYWCVVPESARWLLRRGRVIEAKAELQRAAQMNRVSVDIDEVVDNYLETEDKIDISEESKYSIVDLIRTPHMRRRTFILTMNWFITLCSYYTVAFMYRDAISNVYLNSLVVGLLEMAIVFFMWIGMNIIGRRPTCVVAMVVGGVALTFHTLLDFGYRGFTDALVTVARMCVIGVITLLYVYTPELYPTGIRTSALGVASALGHAGAMVAPLFTELRFVWNPLPTVILGVLCVVSGLLFLLLPETLNQILPDTMEEAEALPTGKPRTECALSGDEKKSENIALLQEHSN